MESPQSDVGVATGPKSSFLNSTRAISEPSPAATSPPSLLCCANSAAISAAPAISETSHGRVRPGRCFHLLPRGAAKRMRDDPVPEVQRTDVETLAIRARGLLENSLLENIDIVDTFHLCSTSMMDHPPQNRCDDADASLLRFGAISSGATSGNKSNPIGKLTPIGQALSRLPLSFRQGVFLLLAKKKVRTTLRFSRFIFMTVKVANRDLNCQNQ